MQHQVTVDGNKECKWPKIVTGSQRQCVGICIHASVYGSAWILSQVCVNGVRKASIAGDGFKNKSWTMLTASFLKQDQTHKRLKWTDKQQTMIGMKFDLLSFKLVEKIWGDMSLLYVWKDSLTHICKVVLNIYMYTHIFTWRSAMCFHSPPKLLHHLLAKEAKFDAYHPLLVYYLSVLREKSVLNKNMHMFCLIKIRNGWITTGEVDKIEQI